MDWEQARFMSGAMPPPKIITLTKPFLDVLHVDSERAYALQPCFATRVQVYSLSNAKAGRDPWLPHALLIGQCGQLYLFDLNPAFSGCIVNAAMLRPDGPPKDETNKAVVELIVEDPPNPKTETQCVYIRCHQQLSLSGVSESKEREGGNAVTSPSPRKKKQSRAEDTSMPLGEGTAKGVTSSMFPSFFYLLRFHCKNMPVGTQFVHMLTCFADPKCGELSLRYTQGPDLPLLKSVTIVDPAASFGEGPNSANASTHNKSAGSSKLKFFKRLISTSKSTVLSPEQTSRLYMHDVAKYEINRIHAAGEDVVIPPPIDMHKPLQRVGVPAIEYDNNNYNDGPPLGNWRPPLPHVLARHPTLNTEDEQNTPVLTPSTAEVSMRLNASLLEAQSRSFKFPATEDVLTAHGLPGFESQLALFLVQDDTNRAVAQVVDRLLSFYPHVVFAPQDRLLAREIAREYIRTHFGSVYSDLCRETRRRIDSVSFESLAAEAEREEMDRAHALALQKLQEEMSTQEALQARDEANAFFGEGNELKSAETGLPLALLCEEEIVWRAEVAEAAAALYAVELSILRLDESMAGEENNSNNSINSSNNNAGMNAKDLRRSYGRSLSRFASITEEAEELLRQIREEEQRLRALTQNQENRGHRVLERQSQYQNEYPRQINWVSELGEKGVEEMERMRVEYNAWVLQQQEEIDRLRSDLQRSAARFGIDAQWMTQLNNRRRVVDEVLDGVK